MELFLENHWQYIKNFVIKLIFIQSCTFCHFTKKLYLKKYVWNTFRPIFLRKTSPEHYFRNYITDTIKIILRMTKMAHCKSRAQCLISQLAPTFKRICTPTTPRYGFFCNAYQSSILNNFWHFKLICHLVTRFC